MENLVIHKRNLHDHASIHRQLNFVPQLESFNQFFRDKEQVQLRETFETMSSIHCQISAIVIFVSLVPNFNVNSKCSRY